MNGEFSHLNCDGEKSKSEIFLQQQMESRAKLRHRLEEMAEVLGLAILQRLEASYNSHSDSVLMLKHAESCLSSCFPHH